jgi:uncharacterized protein (TIGR02246 family)
MTATIDHTDTATAAAIGTALAQQLEQAWNQADGTAFAAAFTEDADFVDIRADHHQGHTAIGHGHQGIFDSIYAGSTVRYAMDTARWVAPGVVVAVVSSTLDAPTGPLQGVNHARFTLTVVERDGGWRIAALQNTLVPPRA